MRFLAGKIENICSVFGDMRQTVNYQSLSVTNIIVVIAVSILSRCFVEGGGDLGPREIPWKAPDALVEHLVEWKHF